MDALIQHIMRRHQLTFDSELSGGHTGAKLCVVRNAAGERKVLKVGHDSASDDEIRNNVYGYRTLHNLGLSAWLPRPVLLF